MPTTLKSVAKALLPPVVTQALRSTPSDPFRHAPARSGGYFLRPGGKPFFIRDTYADREVCNQVFVQHDYALERTHRTDRLTAYYDAAASPLIIDAGANIGAASVWFADTFPRARIVAIEPETDNFTLLCRNADSYESIVPLHAAISATDGRLIVTDPGGGSWAFRTSNDEHAVGPSVAAMSLEKIMGDCGPGDPFILKIDIEGAEADLFSRQSELFDRFPLVIIELHDWMLPNEDSSKNFLRWHVAMARDFVFSNENVFSISQTLL